MVQFDTKNVYKMNDIYIFYFIGFYSVSFHTTLHIVNDGLRCSSAIFAVVYVCIYINSICNYN